MWLTLVWRVRVPGCPQLDDEERRPADSIDQHDDQGHSHCLGHGFCDAWRWSGRIVWGGIVNGAAWWARRKFVGRVRLLAVRAVQHWLLCRRGCCCHMFATATVVLNDGWCLAVMAVIERVVIHPFYNLSSSPVPASSSSRSLSPSLPGPLILFLKAVEAEEDFILLQLSHHHPLWLQVDVIVNFSEDSYLKNRIVFKESDL